MNKIELQAYDLNGIIKKKEFKLLKDALSFKKELKKKDKKLKFRIVKLA